MSKDGNNSNKCPICGRPTHKESKYCIFNASAEEKTKKEFKKALKEYVNKIKKKDKDYDFKKFIFVGKIDFIKDLNITVIKNANFSEATFEGDANFSEVTFEGDANFKEAIFKENADFWEATFEGDADFWEATFERYAGFTEATFKVDAIFGEVSFKGYTSFGEVNFEGGANFVEATFEVHANFAHITFKGNANFAKSTFKGNANFIMATFKGDADFWEATFLKNVSLEKIRILPGNKLFLKARNNIEIISLERAYLENTYLSIELVEDILIDFTGALLKNTKIKKGQIENRILQEKKKKFYEAQEIYLLLKNNFHSIGQYEDESWAFKKEKEMERLSHSFPYYKKVLKEEGKIEKFFILKWIGKGNFIKWIISVFQI